MVVYTSFHLAGNEESLYQLSCLIAETDHMQNIKKKNVVEISSVNISDQQY